MSILTLWAVLCCLPVMNANDGDEWKPAQGPLATRWAEDVSPELVHPEYPRPQMVRPDWESLNGLWEYAIQSRSDDRPQRFEGKILVPFPAESALSGVMKKVGPDMRIWYRRLFAVPESWRDQRILLHFGAVDWEAQVWINGQKVGDHCGGYDAFSFDVTSALLPGPAQEILVAAWDPTDAGYQPRGKQVINPHGIWYTPCTGIWQSVWLEPVPFASIDRIKMVPDIDADILNLQVTLRGAPSGGLIKAAAFDGERKVAEATARPGEIIRLGIDSPKLWSPEKPFLYDLEVTLLCEGSPKDRVSSYFGMRKISLGEDDGGVLRLFLNNEPLFQYGPLDQGFWPDGIYTAPTDLALRYDIEVTKQLGFNMARKHVKIEPERWYYWCDVLGLLVWQDMPSGDKYIGGKDPDVQRVAQSARQFERELKRMIDGFFNHPSIVMWVPYNEGWGQYATERIVEWIKKHDPTRLVNNASGWTDRGVGDVHDIHSYPGPAAPRCEPHRAAVLGEFGGLGLPVKGHTWQDEKNWGYRSFESREALTDAYVQLLRNMKPLIGSGLAAAVYTQTTDVEIEINGLMTYDRSLIKMDQEKALKAALQLYEPPPVIRNVISTARDADVPAIWRYVLKQPAGDWKTPDYNDGEWQSGPAGFGKPDTPNAVVHTEWTTSDIWIRRSFILETKDLKDPHLLIHHDEDATVFLNGRLAAKLSGYTTSYVLVPLEPMDILKEGQNTFAVHCRQTGGGQFIDLGLVDLE